MIITITLNPAVDINYHLGEFALDTTNRVENVSKTAGGKGLNVARVVKQLGEKVGASGFLGGSLGTFIRNQLKDDNIEDFFVEIHGETRNCIAIIHDEKQTEILESGPTISQQEQDKFLIECKEFIKQAEIVTISGSLPAGLNSHFYQQLVALCNEHEKRVFLDTGGAVLKDILESKDQPYLIKPNEEELADLVNLRDWDELNIAETLQSPLFQGVEWVIVTLGKQGGIVKHRDELYQVTIPSVEAINPVGSGDSVIAGFAVGMKRGLEEEELITFGLTMGVLNAMEEKTGSINVDKVTSVTEQITVQKLTKK